MQTGAGLALVLLAIGFGFRAMPILFAPLLLPLPTHSADERGFFQDRLASRVVIR